MELYQETEASGKPDILTAEGQLRRALENGELILHYQPIVRMKGKTVEGFEALVRWVHPERETIEPREFIPLAEETGLITELDRWTVKQACEDIAKFTAQQKDRRLPFSVSVNVSARTLTERDYGEYLLNEIKKAGVSPESMTVEVTEGVLIDNPSTATHQLNILRQGGISIALDDFGTGYSSLQYLNRLPIDKVKIDRSFIRQPFTREDDRRLIKGMLALAADLGMETVTEGIEREDEYQWVLEQGATYGQGYYFGYPFPFEESVKLLF